jgi:hypothetical protein
MLTPQTSSGSSGKSGSESSMAGPLAGEMSAEDFVKAMVGVLCVIFHEQ